MQLRKSRLENRDDEKSGVANGFAALTGDTETLQFAKRFMPAMPPVPPSSPRVRGTTVRLDSGAVLSDIDRLL
jgi:hypothetical protein